MQRVESVAIRLAVTGIVAAALVGCGKSDERPGRPSAAKSPQSTSTTSSPTASVADPSPTPSATVPAYTVGEALTGGEFASQLLERLQGQTFTVRTQTKARKVTCRVTGGSTWFAVFNPTKGIREVRVVNESAYVEDQPGRAKPWWAHGYVTGEEAVPSEAIADALNLADDVGSGDCRWDERLAAIDPTGAVQVTKASATGWTLSVPTDPEDQGKKFSDSERTYPIGTWVLDRLGRPLSYTAADASRVLTYSGWGAEAVTEPPESLVRH